jgi:hypothetical protein
LRLFYGRFAGKKPRKKKNVKRQGLHTSSFTLQERGMMPETGANQCHFVMQFTARALRVGPPAPESVV